MNDRQRTKLRARFVHDGNYRKFNGILKRIEKLVRKTTWRNIKDLENLDLLPILKRYIPRTEYIKIEFDIDDPAIQKKSI